MRCGGTAKRTGGRVVRAFKAVEPGREFKRCTPERPLRQASRNFCIASGDTSSGLAQAHVMPERCGLAVVRHPEKDEHALVVAVLMDRRTNFAPPLTPRLRGVAAEIGLKAKK